VESLDANSETKERASAHGGAVVDCAVVDRKFQLGWPRAELGMPMLVSGAGTTSLALSAKNQTHGSNTNEF
jgi:hypothetical protein